MTVQPLVSIIIPTYNNKEFILRAIHSVFEQTYKNVECVIVDDGSTDETSTFLADLVLQNKIKYFSQANKGVSAARNLGVKKAIGEYILFLDADDLLTPQALNAMVVAILTDGADMCVGLEKGETFENVLPYRNNFLANLIVKWWPVSAVLIKKNNFHWNEKRKTWEVIDYFSTLLLNDFKCTSTTEEVTEISHDFRAERTTIIYDHYNAEATFNFFNDLKKEIIAHKKDNHEVLEAIDKQLLANIYTYYCNEKAFPPNLETKSLTSSKLSTYNWYKPFGISGFCKKLGIKTGMKIFYKFNFYLKRT